MRPIPIPGETYRHFKNKYYLIIAMAKHSETGEDMVVYQALYGDYGVWVRPLSMFLEPVDHEKYPEATQKYRFEVVEETPETTKEAEESLHPLFYDFLDVTDTEVRLALLQQMKGKVGQRELDNLCFSLDLQPMRGELDLQIESLKDYLRMKKHFDAPRLRRGEY